MNKATVRLTVPDPAQAVEVLAPDNDESLSCRVDGQLIIEARADKPMGLLRSLDDALGCLRATGLE